jgi:predicted nucleic acid-binding protein
VKLVADANVLLSAVLGGRANLVLRHPLVEEILTTEVTLSEVEEYAAQLARKKRLSLDVVLMAVAALPLTLVDQATYSASLPDAKRRIGGRDPDDVDLLALALHTGLPVWSNDNDFSDAGVEWFTTAELLVRLGAGLD